MSTATKYYQANLAENPYTMEQTKNSSRVKFLEELIVEHTPVFGTILDVGCGDMYLASKLTGYQWTGLDCNLAVNAARAIRHDIEAPPYPLESASFDTVICSEVLEHLFDPVKVTLEIARVLKPNGIYILSTPNFDYIEHFIAHFRHLAFDPAKSWTKEHIHFYNLESHDKILARAGLKRVYYTGGDPHFNSFYQPARQVLTQWLMANKGLELELAQIECDKLISEMFKDWMHTLVIVARKA